jgi:hypothetical protein
MVVQFGCSNTGIVILFSYDSIPVFLLLTTATTTTVTTTAAAAATKGLIFLVDKLLLLLKIYLFIRTYFKIPPKQLTVVGPSLAFGGHNVHKFASDVALFASLLTT